MTTTAEYCLQLVNQLYEGISGFSVSINSREQEGKMDEPSLTYGELTDTSIVEVLAVVKPQPGEVFYDLGSGAGKPVLWASVLYDWRKCCGVELLKGLYELSLQQAEKLKSSPELGKLLPNKAMNVEFINNDILNQDFSDANVILTNATAFSQDLWKSLTDKFIDLPIGTRIMSLTKSINMPEFEQIHSGTYLMTWGMNSVHFYQKVK